MTKHSFPIISHQKIHAELGKQLEGKDLYIKQLEAVFAERGIDLPVLQKPTADSITTDEILLLKNASLEELKAVIDRVSKLSRRNDIAIEYNGLSMYTDVATKEIDTVWTALRSLLFGACTCPPKKRVDILKDLTGVIEPGRTTFLIGPPGSGKSGK